MERWVAKEPHSLGNSAAVVNLKLLFHAAESDTCFTMKGVPNARMLRFLQFEGTRLGNRCRVAERSMNSHGHPTIGQEHSQSIMGISECLRLEPKLGGKTISRLQ